jgi:hypothetical protein
MRATEDQIREAKRDLSTYCPECEGADRTLEQPWARKNSAGKLTLAQVTKPANKASQPVPFEIPAPLGQLYSIPLQANEMAWVQIQTRFFLCGDQIKLSVSLHPVEARHITTVKFHGLVTGPQGEKYPFDFPSAKPVPRDRMGCNQQTRTIASLSSHEKDLIQTTFLDGSEAWSRKSMIEHMLGRFSLALQLRFC